MHETASAATARVIRLAEASRLRALRQEWRERCSDPFGWAPRRLLVRCSEGAPSGTVRENAGSGSLARERIGPDETAAGALHLSTAGGPTSDPTLLETVRMAVEEFSIEEIVVAARAAGRDVGADGGRRPAAESPDFFERMTSRIAHRRRRMEALQRQVGRHVERLADDPRLRARPGIRIVGLVHIVETGVVLGYDRTQGVFQPIVV